MRDDFTKNSQSYRRIKRIKRKNSPEAWIIRKNKTNKNNKKPQTITFTVGGHYWTSTAQCSKLTNTSRPVLNHKNIWIILLHFLALSSLWSLLRQTPVVEDEMFFHEPPLSSKVSSQGICNSSCKGWIYKLWCQSIFTEVFGNIKLSEDGIQV